MSTAGTSTSFYCNFARSDTTFLLASMSGSEYPKIALAATHPPCRSPARPVVAKSRPVRKKFC